MRAERIWVKSWASGSAIGPTSLPLVVWVMRWTAMKRTAFVTKKLSGSWSLFSTRSIC